MTVAETKKDASIFESFRVDGDRLIKQLETPAGSFEVDRRVTVRDGDLRGAWLKGFMHGSRTKILGSKSPSVRTVELFCGPGGLGLGFGEACRDMGTKMESEAAADIDEGAVAVYAANHGTKVRSVLSASELVDRPIRGRGEDAEFSRTPAVFEESWQPLIGKVDAVLAGPPCQGHSNLNNHTRRTDRRNELYFTVPAMAVALEADVVIIENVPAVIHDSSQVVATTETLLRSNGYEVETGAFGREDGVAPNAAAFLHGRPSFRSSIADRRGAGSSF